jgi:tight adherence protein B
MFDSSEVIQAGPLIAIMALMIIIMFTLIGGFGYVVVLRPRLRLRRRMAEFNLVARGPGKRTKTAVNPRQSRIQEKLQELEDKANKKKKRNELRTELLQAGLDINVRRYFLLTSIAGIGVGGLAIMFKAGILVAIVLAILGFFVLPKLVIRQMAKARQKKFTQNFASAIDIIVRGVRSGLPLGECLNIIGRESPEPVGEIIRLLVEGTKLGISMEDLLARGLERMPTTEFKFFSIVLVIQQQTGGNLAETLDGLSKVLRERKKLKDRAKALSSEAKASASIIGCLPFFVAGMVSLISPDYMAVLFTEETGNIMLAGGLCWMGIGVLVMKKMINFNF